MECVIEVDRVGAVHLGALLGHGGQAKVMECSGLAVWMGSLDGWAVWMEEVTTDSCAPVAETRWISMVSSWNRLLPATSGCVVYPFGLLSMLRWYSTPWYPLQASKRR